MQLPHNQTKKRRKNYGRMECLRRSNEEDLKADGRRRYLLEKALEE
jgi:hypothetical protein